MARKLVNTKKISHEEWLELRKRGIGGSDSGGVIGVSPWSSAITVYADKLGLSKPKEETEAMRLGTDLESYVAQRFTEDTGKKVKNDNFMYLDDEYDFLIADIDRRVIGENAGLECKTMKWVPDDCNLEAGLVPDHYYSQCQHYMMVMGFDRMYLDIYVLQEKNYVFTVDRNDEFIKDMRAAEIDFWQNNVLKKVAPAPSGQKDSTETIQEIYSKPVEGMSVDIANLDSLITDYQTHATMEKEHAKQKEEVKNIICAKLGNATESSGTRYGCTWKPQNRTGLDTARLKAEMPEVYKEYSKVTTSRSFRVKEFKKKQ